MAAGVAQAGESQQSDGAKGPSDDGKIRLQAEPTKVFVGEPTTLTAHVTHPSGDDVDSDSTVDFTHNGNSHADDVDLNSDNEAISGWTPAAGEEGSHTFKASVAGDYSLSSNSDTVTVKPAGVLLRVLDSQGGDASEVPAGEELTLEARLEPERSDRIITFFRKDADDEDAEWDEIDTATTDADGTATLDVGAMPVAAHRYLAWFDEYGDGVGYEDPDLDESEIDEDYTEGTFKVDAVVLYGLAENHNRRDEGEDRFVIPGHIYFRAETDPYNIHIFGVQDRFKWKLEAILGAAADQIEPEPDWGDGVHATGMGRRPPTASYSRFWVRELPEDNNGFGEKGLSVEVVDNDETAEGTPRLFFEPMGEDHPDPGKGQTPNWYYYWAQEGSPAVCEFSRDANHGEYAKYWSGGTAFGKYEPNEGANGTIYLSSKVATGDTIEG